MELSRFLAELWIARWALLSGFGVTVAISLLAIVAGTGLGLGVGLLLTYGARPLRWLARGYTDFIRGTPVLVLILASFYVLGFVGIQLSAFAAGVFALTLFCSSHIGEILRGALQTIPKGQTEAAKAIGLRFSQTFAYVLLPIALRQMLPAWINAAVEIVKASTLVSVIGVVELLLATQQVIARNFMSLDFYLLVGVLYFIVNVSLERLGRVVERRITIPT